MNRPSSNVLARRATRVRPGVIVSTVTEAAYAQTVTFIRDPRERVGFQMIVRYSPTALAREGHERACAAARHPAFGFHLPQVVLAAGSGPRGATGVHLHFETASSADVLGRLESRLAARARRGGAR